MQRRFGVSCIAVLITTMLSCSRGPDPNKVGVFCSARDGVHTLSVFAKDNGMGVVKITGAEFVDAVPRLSQVTEFFINLPDARVSDAKIYWPIEYGDSGTDFSNKPYKVVNLEAASVLPTSIELVKGSMYRVVCETLASKDRGLVGLEVDKRFYLVELGDPPTARSAPVSMTPKSVQSVPTPVAAQQAPEATSLRSGKFTGTLVDCARDYTEGAMCLSNNGTVAFAQLDPDSTEIRYAGEHIFRDPKSGDYVEFEVDSSGKILVITVIKPIDTKPDERWVR